MLDAYVSQTQRLLQNPGAPTSLYSEADIISWINIARGQLAGDAECIRAIGTVSTVVDQRPYNFADLDIGDVTVTGIEGVINIRRVSYGVGNGQRWIPPRPWEWFDLYEINNPVPVSGVPKLWSQYAQGAAPPTDGSAQGGSFYIGPPPDDVYTLYCDCTCFPAALADDSDPEAIPYLFTDAVPFFAACYALWSSQTNARMSDAEHYFNTYKMFLDRARQFANPSVGRWQYSQGVDPVQPQKLGYNKPGGPLLGGGGQG